MKHFQGQGQPTTTGAIIEENILRGESGQWPERALFRKTTSRVRVEMGPLASLKDSGTDSFPKGCSPVWVIDSLPIKIP